ncbi:MAG TPA: hypothetical protein VFW03_11380 [Gemmatimonadaceae bacterium]|nr:hypothetical protein [Gemmatimonadaceae bacterium]
MPQRITSPGPGLRVLLAIIGAAALGSALIVATAAIRSASLGSAPVRTSLALLVAGVVAVGGGLVLRGAIRGRIAVRDPRGHR